MAEVLEIDRFIACSRDVPVFDVRTPAEFEQGHIPGALNLPLFTDEERARIGTTYKTEGRDAAMLQGLDLVGPRMRRMVEAARARAPGPEALVHCWRGGMRSQSVAWLLGFFGYRVRTLRGGYKAFRRYVLDSFVLSRPVYVLSGPTGSGKTDVLQALAARGEQVVDLEALAHHKGSVFGALGEPPQPSQEHFENRLALAWRALDPDRPVWIEDESRRIGTVRLPDGLWAQLQEAPVFLLEAPAEMRVPRLVRLYGGYPPEALRERIRSVQRRLGGANTQAAEAALGAGDLTTTCRILLQYYDRAYRYALSRREPARIRTIPLAAMEAPGAVADQLLATAR